MGCQASKHKNPSKPNENKNPVDPGAVTVVVTEANSPTAQNHSGQLKSHSNNALTKHANEPESSCEPAGTVEKNESTGKQAAVKDGLPDSAHGESANKKPQHTESTQSKTQESESTYAESAHARPEHVESKDVESTNVETPTNQETASPSTDKKTASSSLTQHLSSSVTGEDFAKNAADGLYLLYEPANQGTFLAKYSKEFVPSAIAYAKRHDTQLIPLFKYKQPVALKTSVLSGPNNYYEAWLAWFKEARLIAGTFVLLPKLEEYEHEDNSKFYPMKIVTLSGHYVKMIDRRHRHKPVDITLVDLITIVPETYTGLDIVSSTCATMERQDFLRKSKAPQYHAYIEL